MKKIIAFVLAFAPVLASAQTINNLTDVAAKATNIGNLVIGIAIALAVLWIIISVVRYLVMGGGDPEKRKEGGYRILFGVVGLAVIMSIWGLVYIVKSSFRTNDQTPTSEIDRTTTLPFRNVPN